MYVILSVTLPKTNIASKNRQSQKEFSSSNHHFWGVNSLLVWFGVWTSKSLPSICFGFFRLVNRFLIFFSYDSIHPGSERWPVWGMTHCILWWTFPKLAKKRNSQIWLHFLAMKKLHTFSRFGSGTSQKATRKTPGNCEKKIAGWEMSPGKQRVVLEESKNSTPFRASYLSGVFGAEHIPKDELLES